MNFLQELKKLNLTTEEHKLKEEFKKLKSHTFTKAIDHKKILIPIYNDYGMMKMIYTLIKSTSKENSYILKYFHVYTAVDSNEFYSTDNLLKKKYYKLKNYFNKKKSIKILDIKNSDIIGTNFHNFTIKKYRRTLLSKNDVLKIKVNKVIIGDLIYDHYLRFYEKATIDLNDCKLYIIINYAEQLVNYWENKLINQMPNMLILPYTAYLHWGVIARVALSHKIKVINIGSPLYIAQELDIQHQFHSKNFHLYKEIWLNLTDKKTKLKIAKSKLDSRLSGNVDDITYMKQTAYSSNISNSLVKRKDKNAVIFLHCFFDSPHIYGSGLFSDFQEWIDHILTLAKQNTNINYYIKQHPNGLSGNDEIVNLFIKKYKNFENIIFLDKNISNLEISKFKPNAIFTFYGTVAQEFAYLKFPVILAGDSPMKDYKFCYQPSNITKFNYYINEVGNYSLPDEYNEEELLSFYYMHYNYYSHKYNSENKLLIKNFNNGDYQIPTDNNLENLIFNSKTIL